MPGHTKGKKPTSKMPKKNIALKKNSNKLSAFGKEFQKHSPGDVFSFRGKNYVRVTADEVKKAGFKTLRDYLNSKGKKITKNMGPGTKTGGGSSVFKKPIKNKKIARGPVPRVRARKPIIKTRVAKVRKPIKKGSRTV